MRPIAINQRALRSAKEELDRTVDVLERREQAARDLRRRLG
jgi:hypothetical protein